LCLHATIPLFVRIKEDDKLIQEEGVDSLSEAELREDCRERGMLGLRSVEEMRQQVCVVNNVMMICVILEYWIRMMIFQLCKFATPVFMNIKCYFGISILKCVHLYSFVIGWTYL
jgi:hypothetical protein